MPGTINGNGPPPLRRAGRVKLPVGIAYWTVKANGAEVPLGVVTVIVYT